jgi:hypothetical protein
MFVLAFNPCDICDDPDSRLWPEQGRRVNLCCLPRRSKITYKHHSFGLTLACFFIALPTVATVVQYMAFQVSWVEILRWLQPAARSLDFGVEWPC